MLGKVIDILVISGVAIKTGDTPQDIMLIAVLLLVVAIHLTGEYTRG